MKLKVSIGKTAEDIRVTNADTGEQIGDCAAIWLYISPEVTPAADVIFGHGEEQRLVRITEFTCTLEEKDEETTDPDED